MGIQLTSCYISLPHIKLNNSNIESLSRYIYIRNLTVKHTTWDSDLVCDKGEQMAD